MTRLIGVLFPLCWIAAGVFGQVPTISSVSNAGTHDSRLCPGAIATISGAFTPKATATIGGKDAYVFQATATHLTVQIPSDVSVGSTKLIVLAGGKASAALGLTLDVHAPSLHSSDSSGKGAALATLIAPGLAGTFTDSPGDRISSTKPAHVGDIITLVASGLGATNPLVSTGSAAPNAAFTAFQPTLTIGGKTALVLFSGLLGTRDLSLIGTYLVAFVVPANTPAGVNDVVLTIGQKVSNAVTLAVASHPGSNGSSIANGANRDADFPVAPGSVASVSVPDIPVTDDGLSVTFNGIVAPMLQILAEKRQIELLVPSELPDVASLNVQVRTSTNRVIFPIRMTTAAPGIFRMGTNAAAHMSGTAWIPMSDAAAKDQGIPRGCASSGVDVSSICAQPAAPGDIVSVYATGLGKATPDGDPAGTPLPTGQSAPADRSVLYKTVITPDVTIGGTPVDVIFSGIKPGTAGVYEVSFRIPETVAGGDAIPVTISMNGYTDTATIAVRDLSRR